MSVTILYKEHPPFPVMATPDGDDLWLTLDDLRSATGWEIRPEGVCREGQCVPIPEGREREFVRESPARFKCGRPCPVARTAGAPRRCPRRVVLRRGGPSPPRDAALAASARFQVARSRGPNALACQLPRQEDLPGLLGVLVRVPVRPARVAGALRRTEGPELRRPCRRAGQRRRRECRAVDSSGQANLSLPD